MLAEKQLERSVGIDFSTSDFLPPSKLVHNYPKAENKRIFLLLIDYYLNDHSGRTLASLWQKEKLPVLGRWKEHGKPVLL